MGVPEESAYGPVSMVERVVVSGILAAIAGYLHQESGALQTVLAASLRDVDAYEPKIRGLVFAATLLPIVLLSLAEFIGRWVGRRVRGLTCRPFVLVIEFLLLTQMLSISTCAAALNATFGPWARHYFQAALLVQGLATFLIVAESGVAVLLYLIGAVAMVEMGIPGTLPRGSLQVLPVAIIAVYLAKLRRGAPASSRRLGLACVTTVFLTICTCFTLIDYGAAMGLNIIPAIASWNGGCFARMMRGCRDTLALYPRDPVSSCFLGLCLAEQGEWDQARALAKPIVEGDAGGSVGTLARKLLAHLDWIDHMRARAAADRIETGDPACGSSARLLHRVALLLNNASPHTQYLREPESLGSQVLRDARAAAATAPACRKAHLLLERALRMTTPRIKQYQTGSPADVRPGFPRFQDLEKEADRAAAAAARLP